MYIYRDIIGGRRYSYQSTLLSTVELIRIGFPLILANLSSTLLLALDRQFVSCLFPNKTYAIYAFAYNILSLFSLITVAFSTVIYPMLKRSSQESLEKDYIRYLSCFLIFSFFLLFVFFPLSFIIKKFLPTYMDSIVIFRILFPSLPLLLVITVVLHNYYKSLGYNFLYFKISLFVLISSSLSNFISYYFFRSTTSISFASVLNTILWFVLTTTFVPLKLNVSHFRLYLYFFVCIVFFYICSSVDNLFLALSAYLLFVIIFSFGLYRSFLYDTVRLLRRHST